MFMNNVLPQLKKLIKKQGKGIKVENTYSGSSGYSSGSAKASDGGFRYIEHGKTVTIIKLPDNKTFCEPIYPDFITVSDTVPQWVLDMSYQNKLKMMAKKNNRIFIFLSERRLYIFR
mgnify:CR=1 FL=1